VPFEYTENVLNSVKPVELIQRILQLAGRPNDEDLILDFFSGSGTTAHAVLKQNAEDGGNRRFIAVQIDEPLARPEASFNSILGMSLTRLRNVSQEIRTTLGGEKQDLGYRLTRVDSSNLADVQLTAEESSQDLLSSLAPSMKTDRSDEDLLFQVLLDWGLDLAAPISIEQVEDLRVLSVAEDALIACFAGDVTDTVVREIAQRHPLRAVFLDAGFATDSARINAEQIFREVSPETEVRAI
jgi:adenine-specific DNA-methyltransferase